MKYRVLISEEPIPDTDTVARLEKLGLRVPFVTSDEDFNIYAYQPEDSIIQLKDIRAIHYFNDSHLKVHELELRKHETKIETFNSVKPGEKVKIRGYRNLVTTVEKVENDDITTRINLRGYAFRFTHKLNHIKKSDMIYENKEYEFNTNYSKDLFIDLSDLNQYESNRFEYVTQVFNLVLRLKLSYTKANVILVNPLMSVDKLFGLRSLSGVYNLKDILTHYIKGDSLLYTNDLTVFRPDRLIITKTQNKNIQSIQLLTPILFKRLTDLDTGREYEYYLNLRKHHNLSKQKLIFNDAKIKASIKSKDQSLLSKYTECFIISPTSTNHPMVQIESNNINSEDLYKALIDDGFIQIVENLDYYMSIIKG